MSSRSSKSASTDIDATLALAIATSRQRETNIAICQRETNVTTRATVLGAPRSGGGRYLVTSPNLAMPFLFVPFRAGRAKCDNFGSKGDAGSTIGANSAPAFQKRAFQ